MTIVNLRESAPLTESVLTFNLEDIILFEKITSSSQKSYYHIYISGIKNHINVPEKVFEDLKSHRYSIKKEEEGLYSNKLLDYFI